MADKIKKFKKTLCRILAIIVALSLSVTASGACNDTIDTSRTASINIYKYDITSAEKDGIWDVSDYSYCEIKESVCVVVLMIVIRATMPLFFNVCDSILCKGLFLDR